MLCAGAVLGNLKTLNFVLFSPGDQLGPYLPELMKRLLVLLDDVFSVHTKELALSALGASAESVKSGILPYFQVSACASTRYEIIHSCLYSSTVSLCLTDLPDFTLSLIHI